MKIDILTLFPNMFEGFLSESIIKKAIEQKLVKISIHDIRDYSDDPHKKVDDYPFGGGKGMVLKCQPIYDALDDLKSDISKVIMMTPEGKTFNQEKAKEFSKENHLILLCGHYEGFDERITAFVDEEVSIGDFVLTGGELPSMVITDAIIRLVDGVIKEESRTLESFNDKMLDYPNYTKPREFKDIEVPEILLSGDHKKIDEWRKNEQLKRTKNKRPDLLELEEEVSSDEGTIENPSLIKSHRIYKELKAEEIRLGEFGKISQLEGVKIKPKKLKNIDNSRVIYINKNIISSFTKKKQKEKLIRQEIDLEKLRKLEELKRKLLNEKSKEIEMTKERHIR